MLRKHAFSRQNCAVAVLKSAFGEAECPNWVSKCIECCLIRRAWWVEVLTLCRKIGAAESKNLQGVLKILQCLQKILNALRKFLNRVGALGIAPGKLKRGASLCLPLLLSYFCAHKKTNRPDMTLPQDPFMLLGVVNMKLRDQYASLDELCEDLQVERQDLEARLAAAGFEYMEEHKRFV